MKEIEQAYSDFKSVSSGVNLESLDFTEVFNRAKFLIEVVTFSESDEIWDFLKSVKERDILELPFWLRSMSYKLAVLGNPTYLPLIQDAINDLKMFSPIGDNQIIQFERLLVMGQRSG